MYSLSKNKMAELTAPDLSTYYGADPQTATNNYNANQALRAGALDDLPSPEAYRDQSLSIAGGLAAATAVEVAGIAPETDQTLDARQREIIEKATLNGRPIPMILGKRTVSGYEPKKQRLAEMLADYPSVAEAIVEHNIIGFHGTTSAALAGVLKNGSILSAHEARKRGQIVGSGERIGAGSDGQGSISFSDWRSPEDIREYAVDPSGPRSLDDLRTRADDARQHIEENLVRTEGRETRYIRAVRQVLADTEASIAQVVSDPESLEARLILANFPIAFGLRGDGYNVHESTRVPDEEIGTKTIASLTIGDIGSEFRVYNSEVLMEDTPLILTDQAHIAELKQLLAEYGYGSTLVDDINSVVQR